MWNAAVDGWRHRREREELVAGSLERTSSIAGLPHDWRRARDPTRRAVVTRD
jgi:hypothetical protein